MNQRERHAWIAAAILYFIGDTATTIVGLRAGFTEANPVMFLAFHHVGTIPGLLVSKLAVAAVAIALAFGPGWIRVERKRAYIPATVAVIGLVIVAINSTVLVMA